MVGCLYLVLKSCIKKSRLEEEYEAINIVVFFLMRDWCRNTPTLEMIHHNLDKDKLKSYTLLLDLSSMDIDKVSYYNKV